MKKILSTATAALTVVLFAAGITLLNSCRNTNNESPFVFNTFNSADSIKPIVIITDFGADVDDAEAIAWLAKRSDISIKGIVVTGGVPEIKAKSIAMYLNALGVAAPVGFSIKTTLAENVKYMASHSVGGECYELSLAHMLTADSTNYALWESMRRVVSYADPTAILDSALTKYPDRVELLVLGPLTEFAKYIKRCDSISAAKGESSAIYNSIKEIIIQGNALTTENHNQGTSGENTTYTLSPDYSSYNLRTDSASTEAAFKLQDRISFAFIGKGAAYSAPISPKQGSILEQYGFDIPGKKFSSSKDSLVLKFIAKNRELGLKSFLSRDKETFYKVFNINSSTPLKEALENIKVYNYPYDLLAAIYVSNPEVFVPKVIKGDNQKHRVINSKDELKGDAGNFWNYIVRKKKN